MVFTLVVGLLAKDAESASTLSQKLLAQAYRKDEGTIDWFVMKDTKNSLKFTIVERYESPASNPIFATWQPMCDTLLSEPYDLRIHNELE
ncbi:hypothetical protein BCR35DRAFT_328500 [Leucosporidium creatinivorum]|uniref:ABM domain-containing protein n=1 Tax=Leucosporidium creatinivorum TaxID=106004 RepID=A0A1Y2G1F7_9BASI|nr:hypothetical protein BCR35DRAFT_328500 [Leucosporidium creatinivorum]